MIHSSIQLAYSLEARRFRKALSAPEISQRQKLTEILEVCAQSPWGKMRNIRTNLSYEEFQREFPVTDYEAWRPFIESQRQQLSPVLNSSVLRYEPTSGSTGLRKWIPYNTSFLSEINNAACAWIFDIYKNFPAVRHGKHFWSLSWIPTELRGQMNTNDLELFPWWQRWIIGRMLLTSASIQLAPTGEAAWWATKIHVAATQDLSLLSVWSPTYALNLFYEIYNDRAVIYEALRSGCWLKHESELKDFKCPTRKVPVIESNNITNFIGLMWPKLSLVSCWAAASSKVFTEELRRLLGPIPIQEKGLWATEGVITIPWQGQHPLAVRSHFYEFQCLESGKVMPSWQLKIGQEVQPIITASHGLLRYRLNDKIKVSGFINQSPCFIFLGRLGGIDLVGEKLSFIKAQEVTSELQKQFPNTQLLCLGVKQNSQSAKYFVLGQGTASCETLLAEALEKQLLQIHHYACARELNQLEPAGARMNVTAESLSLITKKNAVTGQSKMESIVLLN